jgi:replicative DNA helicase
MDERVLPADIGTEKLVLGALMVDDTAMHDIRGVLVRDDFSTETHRRIWDAMIGLYDAGTAVDRITVYGALDAAGCAESVGGIGYLVGLDDGMPKVVNLDAYIQILKDKATLRRIALTGQSLMDRALSGTEAPQSILNSISDLSVSLAPAERATGLLSAKELVDTHGLQSLLLKSPYQSIEIYGCALNREYGYA